MVMCSKCHKRVAVVFINKIENGERTNPSPLNLKTIAKVLGINQIECFKIAGYIDGILNGAKLSGIGEFQFMGCNQLILNEDLSGYTLMYRAIHSVDGDDKLPPAEW